MKKVEKVSIAEISFTLDSDAYLSLRRYLDHLHRHYDNDPDGREIIADIEGRIAELILGEQVYTRVVSLRLIDTIIAQLGTPEEFDGEPAEDDFDDAPGEGPSRGTHGPPVTPVEASIPRRLHRSAEGKILGGVCSGFARYFDVTVGCVRIVFLLPMLLLIVGAPFDWPHRIEELLEGWSWAFFVTYIVLWIALPMARTPRQRLESRGERVTPAAIRQNLQDNATTPAGRKAASVAAELVNVVGRVALFFVKLVVAVVGFSLMFAAIGMFIVMVAGLINPESVVINNSTVDFLSVFEGMSVVSPGVFLALVLLCVMLPLVVMGLALLSFTFSWRLGRLFYAVTLGLWALAMIFTGVVCAGNIRFFRDELPFRVAAFNENRRIIHDGHYREWRDGEWHTIDRERWNSPLDNDDKDGEWAIRRDGKRVEIRVNKGDASSGTGVSTSASATDSLYAPAVDSVKRATRVP